MTESKFPKLIDYHALKQQFGESETSKITPQIDKPTVYDELRFDVNQKPQITSDHTIDESHHNDDEQTLASQKRGLTGSRLRSYAFAVLTRKEYSKADFIEKLMLYAENKNEVLTLVEELAKENYQSDQRVAEMTMRSQVRQGKGPNRIKLALRAKHLDKALIQEDLAEVDWYEQAYILKIKKYGTEVSKDPKIKAKQIRFLQYRGFEMDAIMKAISRKTEEDE